MRRAFLLFLFSGLLLGAFKTEQYNITQAAANIPCMLGISDLSIPLATVTVTKNGLTLNPDEVAWAAGTTPIGAVLYPKVPPKPGDTFTIRFWTSPKVSP
jgi:hypothetical protein